MWCKQNDDTSWTMCNTLAYLYAGKVVIVNSDSDKRKNYNGFSWESNQTVLDEYKSINDNIINQQQHEVIRNANI